MNKTMMTAIHTYDVITEKQLTPMQLRGRLLMPSSNRRVLMSMELSFALQGSPSSRNRAGRRNIKAMVQKQSSDQTDAPGPQPKNDTSWQPALIEAVNICRMEEGIMEKAQTAAKEI